MLDEVDVFDVYSPGTTTGNRNIINTIASKTKTQAERIILNLDDYTQDLGTLKNEILKVIKDGTIGTWFAR